MSKRKRGEKQQKSAADIFAQAEGKIDQTQDNIATENREFEPPKITESLPDIYEGFLSGLQKTQLREFTKPSFDHNNTRRIDFHKEAADNSNRTGKILDVNGQEKHIEGSEFDTINGNLFGYNGFVYISPIESSSPQPSREAMARQGIRTGGDITNLPLFKKFDENQKFRFLFPAVHPESGEFILKEFIGTKKEAKEANIDIIRKYGFEEEKDGFLKSFYKGFANTIGQTDDLALGVGKIVQYPFKLGYEELTGEEINTLLDQAYDITVEDTDFNDYIASKGSHDFGGSDWFGSGTGQGIASLLQFGGVGRGIRLGGEAIKQLGGSSVKNFAAKSLQNKVAQNVIKKATVDNLARYGASGFVGFGYGFNEAKRNGLSEGESIAFGLTVGGINSFIETRLGVNVDRFLLGGGSRGIAKQLIREVGKDVTEDGLTEASKRIISGISRNASGAIRNASGEAVEEILQTTVEQGARMAYNALFSEGTSVTGQGKFDQHEFDFQEVIGAGIFGFTSALPFSVAAARSGRSRVTDFILDGKKDIVLQSLDKLFFDGTITQDQYARKKAEIETLNSIYVDNKETFDGLNGEFGLALKKDLYEKHIDRVSLTQERKNVLNENEALDEGLGNQEKIESSENTKKKLDEVDRRLKETNEAIERFNDPDFIGVRQKEFERALQNEVENQGNEFGKIVNPISEASGHIKKVITERPSGSRFETISDIQAGIDYAKSGQESENFTREELIQALADEILSKGFHLSPRINTLENREFLTKELGIQEILLPEIQSNEGNIPDNVQGIINDINQNSFENIANNLRNNVYQISDLHSANQLEDLSNFFDNERFEAIQKLIRATERPVTVLFNQSQPGQESRGLFQNSTGALVLSGNIARAKLLKNKIEVGKATKSDKSEFNQLQGDLFHKMVHESGHALIDHHVNDLYRDWKNHLEGGKETVNSRHFQRLLDLAVLTGKVFSGKAGSSYFVDKIYGDFIGLNTQEKVDRASTVVKEFMAEAVSNNEFQELLDSFDINDKGNSEIVEAFYNYPRIEGQPNSILAEIQKALLAMFNRIKGLFTRSERTLLQEAFLLGSNVTKNKTYVKDANVVRLSTTDKRSYDQSIAAYDAKDLYPNQDVDLLDVPNQIIDQVERKSKYLVNDRINEKEVSLTRLSNTIERGAFQDLLDNKIVEGSLRVIDFGNSDATLVTYKVQDDDGAQENKRLFVNKFGDEIFVNTNPFNKNSKISMSKPNAFFRAFGSQHANDAVASENREIINNLRKAQKDGFEKKITLELDETHAFNLGGEKIFGQVNVMYHFPDGKRKIGYTHDLTKVRLSKLLKGGASIEMIHDGSKLLGSDALVLLDEKDNIVDAVNARSVDAKTANELASKGYIRENITPRIKLLYSNVDRITDQALAAANRADTLTPDDVDIDPKLITDPREILAKGIVDDELASDLGADLSFYQNQDLNEDDLIDRFDFVKEGIFRRLRKIVTIYDDLTLSDVSKTANSILSKGQEYLKSIFPENEAEISTLGFESEEGLRDYVSSVVEEVWARFKNGKNREDNQDWSEHGKNPANTVSKKIQYDLEAISYQFGNNRKQWLEYNDAKEVLFFASADTDSFEEFLENLKGISSGDGIHSNKNIAIATELFNHLSRPIFNEDGTFINKESEQFSQARNSWYSQFASYTKVRAITLVPSNDGAFFINNGTTSQVREEAKRLVLGVVSTIDTFKADAFDRHSKSNSKSTPREFAFRSYMQRTGQKKLANGKNSTRISEIVKNRKLINNETLGLNGKDGMSDHNYNYLVNEVVEYFKFIGLDVPKSLLTRKVNSDAEAYKAKRLEKYKAKQADFYRNLIKQKGLSEDTEEGLSQINKMRDTYFEFVENYKNQLDNTVPSYQYQTVNFEKSINLGKKTETGRGIFEKFQGDHTYLELYYQIAQFIHLQIEKDIKKDSADYNLKELIPFAKDLLEQRGEYKSPEFYFDNQFNKRWAFKIKSYSDDLFNRLATNKDGLLDKYKKSPIYKNNTVLDKIKEAGPEGIVVTLAGMKGVEGNNVNAIYSSATDLDFMYMNMAAFNSIGNGTDEYFHIDDIPSDKPNINAYRLDKIESLKDEIINILGTEKTREKLARKRFRMAFRSVKQDDDSVLFKVKDQKAFNKLAKGVDYIQVGEDTFKQGRIFDKENYLFGDAKEVRNLYESDSEIEKIASRIVTLINEEADSLYNEFRSKGMLFPVTREFQNVNNQKDNYSQLLDDEKKKQFKSFYQNYFVNRYHISQLNMGDYIYYKDGDNFTDLNKRKAGSVAPFQRGNWSRQKASFVAINDADNGNTDLSFPVIELNEENGSFEITDDFTTITSDRTDAQGFVTENMAKEIVESYGSLSGFDRIFKPVMFGVNNDNLEHGQPLYLKLSLAILLDPNTDKGQEFYNKYPEHRAFATKVYNSEADMAIFTSGVKVGLGAENQFNAEEYLSQEFDLSNFGVQNNPFHEFDEDELISGGVQMTKQLGDNDNYGTMRRYHDIESTILSRGIERLYQEELSSAEAIQDLVKSQLGDRADEKIVEDLINEGVNIFDNPLSSRRVENLINAAVKRRISLADKRGRKLVNMTDQGLSRPLLSDEQINERTELFDQISNITGGSIVNVNEGYDGDLKWQGTRTLSELTNRQLSQAVLDLESGDIIINDGLISLPDGSPKIYPADALVPDGGFYEVGDAIIATRIPTSGKNSIVASEVVGTLPEGDFGNVIVLGKEGPGLLGYDFDIDGLFTWSKNKSRGNKNNINEMFDIAYSILLDPKNFNEVTTPVDTNILSDLAKIFEDKSGGRYSKFGFKRQLELHKLNTIGKKMIGVSAKSAGVHSVLSQNNTGNGNSPLLPRVIENSEGVETILDDRSYRVDGNIFRDYRTEYVNSIGEKRKVSEIFTQFINASTDNAKLQILGKLNVNLVTAPVVMDMVSHGIDVEYALYFINQPIIKDFVSIKEAQQSASFSGVKENPFDQLIFEYEQRAKEIDANYQFDPKENDGTSSLDRYPGIPNDGVRFIQKIGKSLQIIKSDRRDISLQSLKDMFSGVTGDFGNNNLTKIKEIDSQIAVLDKFRYYNELSRITSNAGQLISLASSYPKTFIELANVKNRIDNVIGNDKQDAKIDIDNLVFDNESGNPSHQPYYALQYRNLQRLMDSYADNKLYADPDIIARHMDIVGNSPVEIQENILNDFYTYILTASQKEENEGFNLTTKTFNGNDTDPYLFVDKSSRVIQALKNALPENEFLKKLNFEESSVSESEIDNGDRTGLPARISANLLVDIEGDSLKAVHDGFNELEGEIDYILETEIDGEIVQLQESTSNAQDLILGHLLYTKGFSMGGFSFSKLLPPEVIKSLDRTISDFSGGFQSVKEIQSRMDQEKLLERNDMEFLIENSELTEDSFISEEEQQILDKYSIPDFFKQAQLNYPDTIKEITLAQRNALFNPEYTNKHIDQWGEGRSKKDGYKYFGAVAGFDEDGIKKFNIYNNPKSVEIKSLVRQVLFYELIKIRNKSGINEIFELTDIEKRPNGGIVTLTISKVDFQNVQGIKQYSRNSPSIIKSGVIVNEEQPEQDLSERNIKGIPVIGTDKIDLAEIDQEKEFQITDVSPIESGLKTANTITSEVVDQINPKKGDLMVIGDPQGDIVVVKVTLSPIKLSDAIDMVNSDPKRKGQGLSVVRRKWAQLEGVQEDQWNDSVLDQNQFRYEFVASIDQDGNVAKWSKKYDPSSPEDISFFDNSANETIEKVIKPSVIKKLETLNTNYNKENSQGFFNNFNSLEQSVLKGYIYSNAIENADTKDLAEILKTGNDISYYNNFNDSYKVLASGERMEVIASRLFRSQDNDFIKNKDDIVFKPIQEGFINSKTGEVYTYGDWFERFDKLYQKEEDYLIELAQRIGLDGEGLKNIDSKELTEIWNFMKRDIKVLDRLAEENFSKVYQLVGNEIGSRTAELQIKVLKKRNPEFKYKPQEDIQPIIGKNFLSVVDFDTKQLAIQGWSRQINLRTKRANYEQQNFSQNLQLRMKSLMDAYFHMKPKSWKDKINIFGHSKTANRPFRWIYEKDQDGKFTGRMIQRYKKTDDEVIGELTSKIPNPKFDPNATDPPENIKLIYKVRIKDIAARFFNTDFKNTLSRRDADRALEIMDNYGISPVTSPDYDSFTDEQRESYHREQYELRILTSKSVIRSEDHPFFEELKRKALGKGPEANLAKAQINFYDFVYNANEELLQDNGYDRQPIDRVIMPKTSMTFWEELSRNGFFGAYAKFVGARDYNSSFDSIVMHFEGQTKLFSEHMKEIEASAIKMEDKLRVPIKQKKLIELAEELVRKGESGLNPSEIEHIAASLSSSSSIPFKTVANRRDFSVRTLDILNSHFSSLIFKKHHDPLITHAQGIKAYYQQQQRNTGQSFNNVINYIEKYSNRTFFGEKDNMSKSTLGRLAQSMATGTVMAHLGLSPVVSGYNLTVGLSETAKEMFSEYGLVDGGKKMVKGFQRLMGSTDVTKWGSVFRMRDDGKRYVFNEKAEKIMELYNVKSFSKTDVEKQHDVGQRYQDSVLALQTASETMIRGVAFLSNFTDSQWNNFIVDKNGQLTTKDQHLPLQQRDMPTFDDASRWTLGISRVQGNYTQEGRRNYHGNLIMKMAMLFKTWMVDYLQARFRNHWTDAYGKEHEGYFVTTAKLVKDYKRLAELINRREELTDLERRNLRKIIYDVAMWTALLLARAPLDEKDPEERYYRDGLAKLSTQLYLVLDPRGMLRNIKEPFANLYMLEQTIDFVDHLFTLQLERAGRDLIEATPGKTAIKQIEFSE